ncbi:DNA mimic domain containing protein [Bacillus phage Chotacabras]|nr:DNA mimic domain containing protein [Bacillus phage Chotacabras]
MRDIEYILDDLEKWRDILEDLNHLRRLETTKEGLEHFENEIDFALDKINDFQRELEEAEKEEAKRFNTSNERAMSEAGHNERDFL